MWFSEYLFLERSWAKDEITLKARQSCCILYRSCSLRIGSFQFYHEFFSVLDMISFEAHVIVSAVRPFTVEGLPFAFLVGTFCRRDSIY